MWRQVAQPNRKPVEKVWKRLKSLQSKLPYTLCLVKKLVKHKFSIKFKEIIVWNEKIS